MKTQVYNIFYAITEGKQSIYGQCTYSDTVSDICYRFDYRDFLILINDI